jgi:hypothetical protein
MMKKHTLILVALISILAFATASRAEKGYLETGGERKLEVLYKKTAGQDLFLDLYYPTGKRDAKCPVTIYTKAAAQQGNLGKMI